MRIGIIGFGGVSKAFIKLLNKKRNDINIIFVLKSNGGLYNFRSLEKDDIFKHEDIEDSPYWVEKLSPQLAVDKGNIDFLIELTPTNSQTGEPALSYISYALKKGISVITGNKGPVIKKYRQLKELAKHNKCKFGISATAGGALPSLELSKFGLNGADVLSFEGILNGTSNFILSEMEKGRSYESALAYAIEEGITENNYSSDVDGYDTAVKMQILSNLLFENETNLEDIKVKGITNINSYDISLAKKSGKRIKLIGRAIKSEQGVKISVEPEVIDQNHNLYNINGRNKAITFKTDTLGEITLSGGESGTINAAAAIYRDFKNLIEYGVCSAI